MNVRRVVLAGIIASLVMGMIEMLFEAVAGAGFWSPMIFIGATLLRNLQAVPTPVQFSFAGVVLGLMGHMMNSVVLGLIFAWAVSRATVSRAALVGAGALYGLVLFAVMWSAILPAIDPVMLKLNGTVFALSHIMWGAALGWLVPHAAGATARLTAA